MNPTIVPVDYTHPEHARELIRLLDTYARDPMGGGAGLTDEVKLSLCDRLAAFQHAHSALAYLDGEAVGLVNCFVGYTTFAARPLLNVHDLVVAPACRGQGIGAHLLDYAEVLARQLGCCKLTLEVLSANPARHLYVRQGFAEFQLDPEQGTARMMQKYLD